jgi:hypothetical protein
LLTHKYGDMGYHMKTTVDIPDALMIRAKKRAAEERRPLRELMAEGLQRVLGKRGPDSPADKSKIRWVTVKGGVPAIDVADRERMHDWISRQQ